MYRSTAAGVTSFSSPQTELEQIVAGEDAPRPAQQRYQQGVFERREVDGAPRAFDDMRLQIDAEILEAENFAVLQPRAAQFCFDVRDQFIEFEWLAHVVVRAVRESLDFVLDFSFRAEHDDRRIGDAPKHRQKRDAVDFRHHDVEHDDIRLELFRRASAS